MSGPRIFVSVAAYCDPLLAFTLTSARAQASRPDSLYFGVVEQALPGQGLNLIDEWSREHMRWIRVDALQARGPCWARALAMGLYQGEDWYLQVDSHTWFGPGWDERLLQWAARCAEHNPRVILSCYPNPFEWRDGQPVAMPVTQRVLAFVVQKDAGFAAEHPVLPFESVPVETDAPVPAIHVAGGCLFAPGRVVDELPYDPRIYFHGEEQSFALRAWTQGWDLFQVPGMPLYHLYTRPGAAPRPMHWSPELDSQRAVRSAALEAASRQRLTSLLWGGGDLGAYGLGAVRSLRDYAAFSGIDYAARTIDARARHARFGY
jgi:Glycosyltransferase (GlcNAc)